MYHQRLQRESSLKILQNFLLLNQYVLMKRIASRNGLITLELGSYNLVNNKQRIHIYIIKLFKNRRIYKREIKPGSSFRTICNFKYSNINFNNRETENIKSYNWKGNFKKQFKNIGFNL